jgi:hypothetical protein
MKVKAPKKAIYDNANETITIESFVVYGFIAGFFSGRLGKNQDVIVC